MADHLRRKMQEQPFPLTTTRGGKQMGRDSETKTFIEVCSSTIPFHSALKHVCHATSTRCRR